MDPEAVMDEIAERNDEFRSKLMDGAVVLHRHIREWHRLCEVLDELRVVPGGADEPLRDTGDVYVDGQRVVWMIHYFDRVGAFRCRPLDKNCIWVLTAMLANGWLGSAREYWQQRETTKELAWNQQESSRMIPVRLPQSTTRFVEAAKA